MAKVYTHGKTTIYKTPVYASTDIPVSIIPLVYEFEYTVSDISNKIFIHSTQYINVFLFNGVMTSDKPVWNAMKSTLV